MPNGIFTNTTEPIFGTVASEDYQGLPATDTLTVVVAPYFSKEFTDDPVVSGDIATVGIFHFTNRSSRRCYPTLSFQMI